jgi:ParB family chromosome partitioning protein
MLEIETLPVIVRELDDKQAVDVQVDSNLLHRERILPSEKAWAYRLKMETLNHNGKKSTKHSHEILTEQTGESKNQIFRYIRLTELVPDLMDKVDERKIAFNPAVELSYLSRSEQNIVNTAIEKYDIKPTLSQAIKIRKLSQEQKLNAETVERILSESINETPKIEKYRKFFPSEYTPKQIDNVIVKLLKNWQKSQLSTV